MTRDDTVLRQSLGEIFGFSADDDAIFEDLRQDVVIEEVAVGATLMAQGDPSDALYVLLQGRLCASVATPNGEQFIGEIRRGETIGETGVITEAPRGATVRATRTSTVARLPRDVLHGLLGRYPSLSLAIARTLISRSTRDSGPRHPGFVPETVCLLKASPGVDLERIASILSDKAGGPTRIITPQGDALAARLSIHEAERAGARVFILADTTDVAWLRLAVSEADEVVRVVDAGDDAALSSAEREIDRAKGAVLPRHTLLLIHPDDAQSPSGTMAWLAPRQVDRHLHMRPGNEKDTSRVGRLLSGRGVGIVFAGGGARGAAHLGAIRALEERGVDFDIVGGTSIGAAIAAWYAMGLRGEALDAAACKVFVESGGPTSDWNLVPILSLVKGRRTRDLAIEAIRNATGRDIDIEDTWTPFFCLAANYTAQEQAVLQDGPLWRALTATYAIPGVLPPVIINGELHVDGGVMNNLPVDVLEEVGAAHTIAVDLLGDRKRTVDLPELPGTFTLLIDRARPRRRRRYRIPGILSMLLNSTVLSSLNRQREMSARASLSLKPDLPKVGLLDWAKFPETIEHGYTSVKAQLETVPEPLMTALKGA